MRLTTKGRYAVTAMADLASLRSEAPTPLSEIAERQKISGTYLEQIFGRLRRAGLVESVRGVGGGYRLAKSADAIAIADIVSAADEYIQTTACDPEGVRRCRGGSEPCLTHDLWDALGMQIRDFLADTSLADVIERRVGRRALEAAAVE